MPTRKPFRPDKNRDRGRSQHGLAPRNPPGILRENRDRNRAAGTTGRRHERRLERERPRLDERAATPRYSAESANSKRKPERQGSRDEAAAGYKAGGGSYWIYGNHAVLAAIDNPNRRIRRCLQAGADAEKATRGGSDRALPGWETVDRAILDRVAGRESVHQGIAAQVDPLPETEVEDIAAWSTDRPEAKIVILDQVTDPHNVGAILRSAAAFGALAVVLTERNAAPESGVLAKGRIRRP